MDNVFYRPELGRRIKAKVQENKINFWEGDLKSEDIIAVIEWLDEEINECQHSIYLYEGRKKRILSMPGVCNTLKSQLNIDEIGLSLQTYKELRKLGIMKVSDLCNMTEDDILNNLKLGEHSLEDIKAKLSAYGLNLKSSSVECLNIQTHNEDELYAQNLQSELEKKFDELFGNLDDEDEE